MRRLAWIAALGMLLSAGSLPADVLHLRDGRSLDVESWRYEGEEIVFEIAGGSVTIPRSLVERIEPSAPPGGPAAPRIPGGDSLSGTKPGPAAPARPAPGRPPGRISLAPPAVVSESQTDAELEKAVDTLKHDQRDQPRRREADSREIARGLALMAARAGEKQDLPEAEEHYREALTYDPRCLPALVGLSSVYLRAGKDLYARAQIQEGLVAYPRDPSLHDLLGAVYYRQENLADAISEWETSLSLRQDPRVAARLEKARKELSVDREFVRTEAPHFTLRYDGGSPSGGKLESSLLDYLEERYRDLSDRFQFVSPSPFVVILYPSRQFHELTGMPASVTGLFDGKIRVPLGGVKALNPEVRAVLVHELTHAFVFGKSGGNCPRWLQEGLAQMVEGRPLLASEERGLARDLAASEGRSWYDRFTYPASLSFTRYLSERFGFPSLVETLDRMRSGLSAEEALRESTRESFADLQRAWMEDLLKKFAERS